MPHGDHHAAFLFPAHKKNPGQPGGFGSACRMRSAALPQNPRAVPLLSLELSVRGAELAAGAAADRHAVHAQAAGAAALHHRHHAVAAFLAHFAAAGIAAGAGEADAVGGHFAFAHAHIHVAAHRHHAVHHHAAGEHRAAHRVAEVLQHGLGHGVGADAHHLHAVLHLLHLDRAARHHHHVHGCRHRRGHLLGTVHRHHAAHHVVHRKSLSRIGQSLERSKRAACHWLLLVDPGQGTKARLKIEFSVLLFR